MNQNIRGAERRMSNEEFRFWDDGTVALECLRDQPPRKKMGTEKLTSKARTHEQDSCL